MKAMQPRKSNSKTTEIDSDILLYLKSAVFPEYPKALEKDDGERIKALVHAAGQVSYRDFCRTLVSSNNQNKCDDYKAIRAELRGKAINVLCESICELMNRKQKIRSQDEFDEWHKKTCEDLKNAYNCSKTKTAFGRENALTVGHAQKWINMTLKNLVALGGIGPDEPLVAFFHAPVDRIIIDNAKELGISPSEIGLSNEWSKWDAYDGNASYMAFQRKLREGRKNITSLFRWEISVWNAAKK